jgi:FKBP-type peptidyl-prolyl cis-trans isomerase
MKYKKYGIMAALFVLLLNTNCVLQHKEKAKKRRVTSEELISVNKYMVEKDAAIIKDYVQRNNYSMQETQTGLWYQVVNQGTGDLIQKGDVVTVDYEVYLLDGELCYSTDSLGYKTFKVGQGGVVTGLEEGILLLKKESEATFIMPPHRAHGLVGDDDKIPGRSILRYEVKVINVSKAK